MKEINSLKNKTYLYQTSYICEHLFNLAHRRKYYINVRSKNKIGISGFFNSGGIMVLKTFCFQIVKRKKWFSKRETQFNTWKTSLAQKVKPKICFHLAADKHACKHLTNSWNDFTLPMSASFLVAEYNFSSICWDFSLYDFHVIRLPYHSTQQLFWDHDKIISQGHRFGPWDTEAINPLKQS